LALSWARAGPAHKSTATADKDARHRCIEASLELRIVLF
jgi:hypothetical protein